MEFEIIDDQPQTDRLSIDCRKKIINTFGGEMINDLSKASSEVIEKPTFNLRFECCSV